MKVYTMENLHNDLQRIIDAKVGIRRKIVMLKHILKGFDLDMDKKQRLSNIINDYENNIHAKDN
jgi:hypothetical protein